MTEVVQDQKAIDQVAEDLASQVFDAAGERFISELRAVDPEAAEKVTVAIAAAKAEFTPEVAREIRELKEAGDEDSLRKALKQVQRLKDLLILSENSRSALKKEVTAEDILKGFKKLEDGIIEMTLPEGLEVKKGETPIDAAGRILNEAAKAKGMPKPVFYEGQEAFWKKNEANSELQTVPGKTYSFKIPTNSPGKSRAKQEKIFGNKGAPIGAIAIAEACERLNTKNKDTLFKDKDGNKVWVRGSARGVALYSRTFVGVVVDAYVGVHSLNNVAFASSVPARNKKS